MKVLSKSYFLDKCFIVHGDEYDYSETVYKNMRTKINIICKKHGTFNQSPMAHVQGQGCRKCGNSVISEKLFKGLDGFLLEAVSKHGNLYDYSKTVYTGNKDKIDIICSLHGIFKQTPNHHMRGRGCPKCLHIISKPETELHNFIKSLGFEVETNNRKILNRKEIDIYIPSLNKAIEFNGLYWHYSDKHFKPGKHALKSNLCREKGIKLLHIREDLWLRDKEKIKETIIKFLKT